MELILKSDNEQSIKEIIALANKLNVIVVKKDIKISAQDINREALKQEILNLGLLLNLHLVIPLNGKELKGKIVHWIYLLF